MVLRAPPRTIDDAVDLLAAGDYIAERSLATAVFLGLRMGRPLFLEGTYDKEKKTMTMFGEAPGPDGKLAKHKMVTVMPDNDHQTFTMYMTGSDGQETKMFSTHSMSPYLDSENNYHRERASADFRNAALRHELRLRRRERRSAAARRSSLQRAAAVR